MIITSFELELDPAPFNSTSTLPRFSCPPESSRTSSRFRLRFPAAGRDELPLEFSSLSDSMMTVSLGVSVTLGVEGCEVSTDDVRDLDRDWMDSNRRWASSTGMVNNREDGPIGPAPTLGGGGDSDGGETPGRAYNSVQCLALLSCCFLFLTYSVAMDGTGSTTVNGASEIRRSGCG